MDASTCIFESQRYRVFRDDRHVWVQRYSDPDCDLSDVNTDASAGMTLSPYLVAMLQPLPFIEQPRDTIMIGLGGGVCARFIHRYFPELRLTAIEIDPEMVEIARNYFALPEEDERFRIVVDDGVEFIHKHETQCDLILSDSCDENNGIVDALHDEAFYKACHRILRPSGVMTVNIFRPDANWGQGYLAMLNSVFAEVYYIKIEENQFVMVLCKDKVSSRWPAILQTAKELDAREGLGQFKFGGLVRRLQANLAIRRKTAAK